MTRTGEQFRWKKESLLTTMTGLTGLPPPLFGPGHFRRYRAHWTRSCRFSSFFMIIESSLKVPLFLLASMITSPTLTALNGRSRFHSATKPSSSSRTIFKPLSSASKCMPTFFPSSWSTSNITSFSPWRMVQPFKFKVGSSTSSANSVRDLLKTTGSSSSNSGASAAASAVGSDVHPLQKPRKSPRSDSMPEIEPICKTEKRSVKSASAILQDSDFERSKSWRLFPTKQALRIASFAPGSLWNTHKTLFDIRKRPQPPACTPNQFFGSLQIAEVAYPAGAQGRRERLGGPCGL